MSIEGTLRAPLQRTREARYSRFVRVMKVLLPATALTLLLLLLFWPQVEQATDEFKVGLGAEDASVGQPVLNNARLMGTDGGNRPFQVTADRAVRLDPAGPQGGGAAAGQRIGLTGPMGDVTLADGSWLSLDADRGVLDRDTRILVLRGGVDLFQDRGFELHTEAARLDLAAGTARGDRPVRLQGPFGHGRGAGFRIGPEGDTVALTGPSRMVLRPAGGRGQ